jgi:hypothetical protein
VKLALLVSDTQNLPFKEAVVFIEANEASPKLGQTTFLVLDADSYRGSKGFLFLAHTVFSCA